MTLAIIGQALVLAALVAAVGGAVVSAVGGWRLTRATGGVDATGTRAAAIGAAATRVLLGTTAAATFVLLLALAGADFTLAYVADRMSRDLPFGYRLTALWSGQEGSLLLWLLVLALCGVLMQRSLRRAALDPAMRAWSTAVLLAVASFFALLVAVVARPFAVVDQLARDGAGMSPALQNYWMAAHPPALYLGYVGVTVPFAIVAGALLARHPRDARDDGWIAATRGWVLFSWTFLTIGLVLGSRWAYEEIGWGGYWGWDPVENAALMPWLTATALLHSIMVQQRRGMMRFWNAVLASLTFALSIFGTFVTRSGVLSSVHSFVSSPVGWWFIGALTVTVVGSLALLYASRNRLRAHHDIDAVVSRETLLLFNNLLLVSLALVVLWGVLYPILTAAFTEARISLEKPWYDFFAAAFGLPLAALLVFAPSVAWRGTPPRQVLRRVAAPLVAMLVLGIVLVATGLGSSMAGVAAVCLGALVVFGVVADVQRALAARQAAQPDESRPSRTRHVLRRHRRRFGAWLAHAGIAIVVIAVAGSAWNVSVDAELQPGSTLAVGGYDLRFVEVERERTATAMATRAVFEVRRGGDELGTMRAGRDFHPASGEVSNEVAIRQDWLRMHDLFITVDRLTEDGTAQVKAFVNPLVPLLWLGGILLVLGACIVALPRPVGSASSSDRDDDDDRGRGIARNDEGRVDTDPDAVHELRNGAAAPRELLSGLRGSPRRPTP